MLIFFLKLIIYTWIVWEAIITAYLYYEASIKMKKSEIIKCICDLFMIVAVIFGYKIAVNLIKVINPVLYQVLLDLVIIPVIFLGLYLHKFRYWSINTKIPKKKDEKI